MAAPSGDNVGGAGKHAEKPSSATRLLTMNGSRIDSRELFAAEREIIIAHGGGDYRPRRAPQKKLGLNKGHTKRNRHVREPAKTNWRTPPIAAPHRSFPVGRGGISAR